MMRHDNFNIHRRLQSFFRWQRLLDGQLFAYHFPSATIIRGCAPTAPNSATTFACVSLGSRAAPLAPALRMTTIPYRLIGKTRALAQRYLKLCLKASCIT
jgi:hypothetical protein